MTQHVLALVLEHAERHQATRIKEIHLVLGQLASIVDDCVQFYWDIISEGTIAKGAHLCFQRIPAEMRCLNCQQSYRLDESDLACPFCHSEQVQILSGEEFYIDSIEVDL